GRRDGRTLQALARTSDRVSCCDLKREGRPCAAISSWPSAQFKQRCQRDLVAAASDAIGIARSSGFHSASSSSSLSFDRAAMTRPPNVAVLQAAQPASPLTRIGTVTRAASAADSSAARVDALGVARASAFETSSASNQGSPSTAHWCALSLPTAVRYRCTTGAIALGLVTTTAEANGA